MTPFMYSYILCTESSNQQFFGGSTPSDYVLKLAAKAAALDLLFGELEHKPLEETPSSTETRSPVSLVGRPFEPPNLTILIPPPQEKPKAPASY
jgi:hypothetical protein